MTSNKPTERFRGPRGTLRFTHLRTAQGECEAIRVEKELNEIHEHMRGLGLGALAHANWHANYYSPDNEYWAELSVLQAAHACEILIKARIAEEHPLLIFEQVPEAGAETNEPLSLQRLVERGRTFQFSELPDRLWATTGIRLQNAERYRAFGRLRNTIQHFIIPEDVDVSAEAVRFIYDVIDPFINNCWGLYAVDFNEDYEPYVYLVAGLIRRGVRFLVSPGVMQDFEHIDLEWPPDDTTYRREMEDRFKAMRV